MNSARDNDGAGSERRDPFDFIPRGTPAPRPPSPLEEFLRWVWGVTVTYAPSEAQIRAAADICGVKAEVIGRTSEVRTSDGIEGDSVVCVSLPGSKPRMYEVAGLLVLMRLGTARARWPVFYRPCPPPAGADRYPHT